MLPTFLPSMVPVPNLISSHKIASHRNVIVIVLLVSTCHSFISEAQALEMSWRGKGGESYSTNLLMTKKHHHQTFQQCQVMPQEETSSRAVEFSSWCKSDCYKPCDSKPIQSTPRLQPQQREVIEANKGFLNNEFFKP